MDKDEKRGQAHLHSYRHDKKASVPGPGIKAEIHDMLYGKSDKRWDTYLYARTVPMQWEWRDIVNLSATLSATLHPITFRLWYLGGWRRELHPTASLVVRDYLPKSDLPG
jgi:hypothetical protein